MARLPDDVLEACAELLRRGEPLDGVARQLGVNPKTIARQVRRLPLRTKGSTLQPHERRRV